MSTDNKKTIVIVGGGFVGSNVAKGLSSQIDPSKHRVIQITASPKFVHFPSTIRAVVTPEGKLEDRAFMPYGDYLAGKGEVKVGEVVSFTAVQGEKKGEVILAGGEVVEYDVLVLTPGNKWNGPFNFPTEQSALQSHIESWRAKIEKARSIVLVGGGAVGVGKYIVRPLAFAPHRLPLSTSEQGP
jgi:NADH dehydrogenase FAD-containing subunit